MIRKVAVFTFFLYAASLLAQGNKPVALMKGEVVSADGGKVSDVQVSVYKGSEISNTGKSNTEGKFQIILKPNVNYRVTYSHPKYYFKEESVNVPDLDKYREIPVQVTLRPLELGRPYKFNAMVFEPKSSKIENDVISDMENIVAAAKRNKVSLRITVYPDETPSGKKAAAQTGLANSRKSALTSYFLTHGVNASSFSCDVSNSVPSNGSFERMITADPPDAATGKKKKAKAKAKPAAATAKKMMVPQYAEIVMQ